MHLIRAKTHSDALLPVLVHELQQKKGLQARICIFLELSTEKGRNKKKKKVENVPCYDESEFSDSNERIPISL